MFFGWSLTQSHLNWVKIRKASIFQCPLTLRPLFWMRWNLFENTRQLRKIFVWWTGGCFSLDGFFHPNVKCQLFICWPETRRLDRSLLYVHLALARVAIIQNPLQPLIILITIVVHGMCQYVFQKFSTVDQNQTFQCNKRISKSFGKSLVNARVTDWLVTYQYIGSYNMLRYIIGSLKLSK